MPERSRRPRTTPPQATAVSGSRMGIDRPSCSVVTWASRSPEPRTSDLATPAFKTRALRCTISPPPPRSPAGSPRWMPPLCRRISPPPPACSPPTATGAISSPSPGTSSPSRDATASPPCSRRRLRHVRPTAWRIDGEATAAAGLTEGWFTFETAVARGKGHVRLAGDRCVTLLTTITELKGHEERRGETRELGVEPGAIRNRQELARSQAGKRSGARIDPAALLRHHRRRPGRHRAWRAPEAPRRAHDHPGEERPRRQLVAKPLQVARPARPRLVRPPALSAVPRSLAGVHAEGPDGRLAGDVRQGDGARLLGFVRMPAGGLRRGHGGVGAHGEPRAAATPSSAASSSSLRPAPTARREKCASRAPRPLPASSIIRAGMSAASVSPESAPSSSARTARPTTSASTSGRAAPTSPWCSARRRR